MFLILTGHLYFYYVISAYHHNDTTYDFGLEGHGYTFKGSNSSVFVVTVLARGAK